MRPPHWDMGRHLYNSIFYFNYLKNLEVAKMLTEYWYYPPFLYWVTAPYYILFGEGVKTAILSNSLFIYVLGFSMYGIGNRLWGRRAGILSSIFILCTPMIVSQFKEYQVDAPSVAMVALSVYAIIRAKEFNNRWWSLGLGVIIGLTVLTKWTLGFTLLLPLLYAVYKGVAKAWKNKDSDIIFNVLIAFLAAFFVFSFWYIQNFSQLKFDLLFNGGAAGIREGDPAIGTYPSNVWYSINTLNNQLYFFPFALFVTGIVFTFRNLRFIFNRNIYPILLIIGTVVFFTLLRNKDARYTLPFLVGISIISTYWIGLLKKEQIRNIVSLLVIIYSVFTFIVISFGTELIPRSLKFYGLNIYSQRGYIIGPPTKENWGQQSIFEDLSRQKKEKSIYIGLSPEYMFFNSWGNRYYSVKNGINIVEDMEKANYLIVSRGNFVLNSPNYKTISSYPLPNGDEALLVEKIE